MLSASEIRKARKARAKRAWATRRARAASGKHLDNIQQVGSPTGFLEAPQPNPVPSPDPRYSKRIFVRRVIIESPYKGNVSFNIQYARACLRDCLNRGEAPIASHLLYTQPGVLDDNNSEERAWGIEAGLMWGTMAHVTAVYTDLGTSEGMANGIAAAVRQGRAIEYRTIPDWIRNQTLAA